MNQQTNYEIEALKLSKAADIAIEAFKKFTPYNWDEKTLNHVINFYLERKNNALNPEPIYKRLRSLKYIIQDIFTPFQEGSGDFVEYFWKEIQNQNLDYIREDKLIKILKRGKIRNIVEFEYITDIIIPAEQEGRITKEQAEMLGNILGSFENKKMK